MDWVIVSFLGLGIPIALAVWLIARAILARERIEELSRRLGKLEREITRLQPRQETSASEPAMSEEPVSAPAAVPKDVFARKALRSHHIPQTRLTSIPTAPEPSIPPRLSSAPIPPVSKPPRLRASQPTPESLPKLNWEQFMGVKMFAWTAGLALFLGIAFFVKYSFDNNLVSPELRVALGFLAGLGLLAGGVVMSRKNYGALSQTLCATGVVVLYAVTFACHAVYHFELFGSVLTFLLMALITTTAFFLSVRLNALVVAILGMLGGFLTPILLSTGQDNPLALFGYVAILDMGLIVVALHRRWFLLSALAAGGTVFTEVGWADKFFTAEKYFAGNKILIALGVLLGFNLLYLGASGWAKRRGKPNRWLWGSAHGLATVAFAFTGWFLTFAPLAQRPWLMFSFVFLVDAAVLGLVALNEKSAPASSLAGLGVFGLLGFWTARSLNNELLNAALVFYFIFALLHSVVPILMQRRRGGSAPAWGTHIFSSLALLLVVIPIFQIPEVSFLVWPFVLLMDLLAIGLAILTVSLLPVLAVMVLTLVAVGILIFQIPATPSEMPVPLFILGAFAIFFVVAGVWLSRKFRPDLVAGGRKSGDPLSLQRNLAAQLPTLSAVLPFLLLIMATLRLPLSKPSPVFGLGLLLAVLLLGVTRIFSFDWMPAIGLACVTALEWAWHSRWFDSANALSPLIWYLVFLGVFAFFPFVFLRQFETKTVPWATAAMSGPLQFFLIRHLVAAAYPNQVMGLLPAAFAILPLLSLVVILKKIPTSNVARITQLAWFGGVTLFFITLIFPIQFDHQWITLGWALEGAALLWLFRRVPHPGLRLTGAALLVAAFVRLAVNPAVLEYHPRSETPLLNWYLYTYGIASLCLFSGARLLRPPNHLILDKNAPAVLGSLGTVLVFLLLNIEIADFFSAPGATLTFQFSGNFARDMTYSIAWALFALVLLLVGIMKTIPASRYAALGLLSMTLLKVFFHDLAHLGQLYRIGALIGVAVIAMLASFAYQRFFSARGQSDRN